MRNWRSWLFNYVCKGAQGDTIMRFFNFLARFFVTNQTTVSAAADVAAGVAALAAAVGTGDATMLTHAITSIPGVDAAYAPLIAIGTGYLAGAISGTKTKKD